LLGKILRYYSTLRHLKLKQIVWRFIYFLPRTTVYVNVSPSLASFESYNYSISKKITSDFENFTFLNETHNLTKTGWDNKSVSKLWRYNLHYFEFLLQEEKILNSTDLQLNLIENWIDLNPFGKGTGWEPYPTSLRIINWIKWHWSVAPLSDRAVVSLWNQVRWLAARPEYHLLGNHLFVNAKALLFASVFFGLDRSSKIYSIANSVLKNELDEQFLSDGAHFELSPMYHSLAMEDLLDLLSISGNLPIDFPQEMLELKFKNGMLWLHTMTYDDGELSHFNDCANGIAPSYSTLKKYADRLSIGLTSSEVESMNHYENSGFVVVKNIQYHLIADVGKIGPDYLPGHAHADTLSFELSVKGHRFIVNSGTSEYGISEERIRQRGTSSHSTVQIDAQDSSEVWSGFRVGRRAIPFNIEIGSDIIQSDIFCFCASHDGYKHLNHSPVHSRQWRLTFNQIDVQDLISGSDNNVVSRFYFHPDITLEKTSIGFLAFKKNTLLAECILANHDNVELLDATYHDEFGKSRANKCLQFQVISPCKLQLKIQIR
jgi:uncharacterized heparinase superfamily protein